jgi:hypothetical protein
LALVCRTRDPLATIRLRGKRKAKMIATARIFLPSFFKDLSSVEAADPATTK